ncbi:hypothetical protein AB0F91_43790 [Amycolatopsis sp. NPDC023774]|uniref:hypothetical protein n=1 Tax=Amycolatopsis sp. NPDC023774 TaxID=3155015 RepID=UPI0033F98825
MWGGGRAFYDPRLFGTAAARVYLVTGEQFGDVAEQEMYRNPGGTELDIAAIVAASRVELRPGRYETVFHIADLDGHPVLTFTTPWSTGAVEYNPPSLPYLRMLAGGLCEAHGWDLYQAAAYQAERPGAASTWTAEALAAALHTLGPA